MTGVSPTAAAGPVRHELLDLVTRYRKHLWIGDHPPFEFAHVFLPGCTNFRASPALHQQFEVVWSYELDVLAFPPERLPLYLDELVRFLGEDGRLVIRHTLDPIEGAPMLIVLLKRHLGRHPFLDVSIETELTEDRPAVTVFRVRRRELAAYRSTQWTFSVLTQGKRQANMLAYLESIRRVDPDRRHEILVCGPKSAAYEPFGVNYIDKTYSTRLADICAKKNDIADAAAHPNLLITHDRYELDANFLAGFDEFGYDFDYLTVAQKYQSGEEFPAYCTMSKRRHLVTWLRPIALARYDRVFPLHYVNGGLIVIKTHAARAMRLNELLFWAQAEDVEFSKWMQEHSLPPRINLFSSATVLGLTADYTAAFLPEQLDDSEESGPPAPPPPPAAEAAPPAPAPPRRARVWLAGNFRRLAAAGLAAVLASQAVVVYLLLTRGGGGR